MALLMLICLVTFWIPPASTQAALVSCSFETEESKALCDYDQDNEYVSYRWIRFSGQTPTRTDPSRAFDTVPAFTGPQAAYSGSYYIYAEATGANTFDRARLSFKPNYVGEVCIKFAYEMYGIHMGTLNIYQGYQGNINNRLIWSMSGNKGDKWFLQSVTARLTDPNERIIVEAVKGNGFSADIAIDSLYIEPYSCSGGTDTNVGVKPINIYHCNFENFATCNMKQAENDHFNWTIGDYETPSRNTGPYGAYEGVKYAYIETSDPVRENDMATLILPKTPPSGDGSDACLSFWLSRNGGNIGRLELVTLYDNGGTKEWLKREGASGSTWVQEKVDVQLVSNGKFAFRGVKGSKQFNVEGDIAIDLVEIKSGRCDGDLNQPWSCNFESFALCNMKQGETGTGKEDQFDWIIQRGGTQTSDTGPSKAGQGEYYAYAETSFPRIPQDRAVLDSPTILYQGQVCVSFMYHMYGESVNDLTVSVAGRNVFFRRSGDQGNRWYSFETNIDVQTNDRIRWTATRGQSYKGDIAIDDLRIGAGACPAPEGTTPPDTIRNDFSCSFEERADFGSSCRVRQDNSDNFDWTRQTGKTPSGEKFFRRLQNDVRAPITGPMGAMDGNYYLYIEASGKMAGMTACIILEGDMFNRRDRNCLRFYYSMNGFHTGILRVFMDSGRGREILWSLSGDQKQTWTRAAVDIDMELMRQIGIEAITTGKFSSDIALDDIELTSGPCQSIPPTLDWMCNFELSDGSSTICNMNQDNTYDVFDWTLHKAKTPSSITGPSNAYNGEYYIYIEASVPRRRGDFAIITLPRLSNSGTICVEFWYHMFGFHIGTLELFLRQVDSSGNPIIINNQPVDTSIWMLTGQQPNEWRFIRQEVKNYNSNYVLAFKAVVGSGYSGDIAIDAIQVRTGSC